MAEDERIIARGLFALLLVLLSAGAFAQNVSVSWKTDRIDGARTGDVAPTSDNVEEAMGAVRGRTYTAPNGRKFRGGATARTAKVMLAAQPAMSEVKQPIGRSTRLMARDGIECALYDWFVDVMMKATEDSTGRKVDIGFTNRGGVRTDMPEGVILYDDIMSMFPFKNYLVYLSLYGRDVRVILEQMASTKVQIIGGVRITVKDGKLVSATVDGEPLDDDRLYGVATINFLLDGGDGYFIGKNAVERIDCNGYIYDVMIPYVKSLTAAGKPVEYQTDGRIRILKEGESL